MLKCKVKGISFLINHLYAYFAKDNSLSCEHRYMKKSRDWVLVLWINRKCELCFELCYWSAAWPWASHFTFLCHCCVLGFFRCSSASSGYAEYSSEQLFLVWMTGAEQSEALVMATVLKKVPNSLKSEVLWGQLEASIGLGAEGCSLGRALPRGVSIPSSSHHRRDRGNARKRKIVKQGISSLPVARECKATWSAQTIDFSAKVLVKILPQNKRLVISNDYRFHCTNAPQHESNHLHCQRGSMHREQPALRNHSGIPAWELCSSPQLQWRHSKISTGLHSQSG